MKVEDLYQRIFNSMTVGLAICELVLDEQGDSMDYRFVKVNAAFEKQTRLKAKSTIGKTVKEIYPDVEQYWIDKFSSVVINNKPMQFTEFNHNTNKYYRVNAFYLPEDKFVMVLEDVTQENKLEQELKKSEKEYRNVFNSMFEMFQVIELIYDKNGHAIDYYYLQVNPAFEKLVNKNKAELVGKRAKEVFGIVEDYWIKTYERVEKTGRSETFENYGAELNKYYSVKAWKSDEGQVAVTFKDITKQKLYEKELIKAKEKAEESDRLKSAFLANMSHEIRTPMNGILGFTELLKTPNLTGEERQEYIQIIGKSGERLLNIINNIISISKIEAGLIEVNISESNINEQIEYIYTFFKPEIETKGMQFLFKNSLPFERANIRTDREKLFAILTNLVKNAIKYSERGSLEVGYVIKDKYVEFYVKDSGIGIDSDRQEIIFERFIQADTSDKHVYQGAGLGLSISKAFVEILGGKLWVESEKGEGSIFYFTIPFITGQQETVKVTKGVIKVRVKNLKVLIVEDNEVSALLLSTLLEKIGARILRAKNGIEAIEFCRNNPDVGLILMDINMPLMDGYEATQQIRQFNKDVIIVAQSGHGLTHDIEKAIKVGCNKHLSKPIIKNELLSLVQQYFVSLE